MIRRLLSRLLATRTVRVPADRLASEEEVIRQIWEETRPTPNDPWVLWADDDLPPGMTAADQILLRDGVIRLPDGAPTLDEWRRRAGEAGQR